MKEHFHKHFSVTENLFISKKTPNKAIASGQQFMKMLNSQSIQKTFDLYQLQKSSLTSFKIFKDLLAELSNFNKKLQNQNQNQLKKHSTKTYHLYRNLYDQLCHINTLNSSIKPIESLLFQINLLFQKEREKLQEVNSKISIKSAIPFKKQRFNQNQEQRLLDTIKQIRKRRQSERFQPVMKTEYSGYFLQKNNLLGYKRQSFSQKNENSLLSSKSFKLQDSGPLSKSIYKTKSLSQINSTKESNLRQSLVKKVNKKDFSSFSVSNKFESSMSNILSKTPVKKLTINSARLETKSTQFSSSKNSIKPRQSFLLIDSMIKKDRIQNMINIKDHKRIKSIFSSKEFQKKEKFHESASISSSKISFVLNPQKTRLIKRGQFMDVGSQLLKKKLQNSKLKSSQNRKLQLRNYLSSQNKLKDGHVLSKKISKSNKLSSCILQEGNIESAKDQNKSRVFQLITNKVVEIKFTPQQRRRKQFQRSLLKKNSYYQSQIYLKYLNHIQLQQSNQSNSINRNKSLQNISKERFQSLTSFRENTLKKKFNSVHQLPILTAFQKHNHQNINEQAINQTLHCKLKISQQKNLNEHSQTTKLLLKNSIYKGLSTDQTHDVVDYLPRQSKLLSNPFFKVKKSKKNKKKKK